MQRQMLWAEDLEKHRQPSLYFLDEEDSPGGPHLVADWNGVPTDEDEFDIDVLNLLKEHEKNSEDIDDEEFFDAPNEHTQSSQDPTMNNKNDHFSGKNPSTYSATISDSKQADGFMDFSNPATEFINQTTVTSKIRGTTMCRQNDILIEDYGNLDFQTVPPVTGAILLREVRNMKLLKSYEHSTNSSISSQSMKKRPTSNGKPSKNVSTPYGTSANTSSQICDELPISNGISSKHMSTSTATTSANIVTATNTNGYQ